MRKLKKLLQWRVTSWYVSYRGWRDDQPDFRVVVTFQEDVWYWRFLEWLCWDRGLVMCDWLTSFKLPMFVRNWTRVWDPEDAEPSTFEEYYGDDLSSIWHCDVEDPIIQFVWKHQYAFQRRWDCEMTLAEAQEKFKDDPDKLRWVVEQSQSHKEYDAEKAAEGGEKPE
jgi:hypothetical protein